MDNMQIMFIHAHFIVALIVYDVFDMNFTYVTSDLKNLCRSM